MILLPFLFWIIALGLALSLMPDSLGSVGLIIAALGFIVIFVLSLRPVANFLLQPLEGRYPPLDLDSLLERSSAAGLNPPGFVAILGAGDRFYRRELPASAQLQPAGLARLVEGIRIVRRLPNARLVACVFSARFAATRPGIADAAGELGVDRVTLATTVDRPSTQSELKALKAIFSNEPFILVTSAGHMPRAVQLCESMGLRPLPAPTDFMARKRSRFGLRALLPSVQSIIESERAVYEYVAHLRRMWTGGH